MSCHGVRPPLHVAVPPRTGPVLRILLSVATLRPRNHEASFYDNKPWKGWRVRANTPVVLRGNQSGNPCPLRPLYPAYPTPLVWFALYLLGKVNPYLESWAGGLSVELTAWPGGPNCPMLSPLESVMLICTACTLPAWPTLSQSVRLCIAMP